MIGVTLGIGRYRQMAVQTAAMMQDRCGIPVFIITNEIAARFPALSPHYLKFHIFDFVDAEDILFFDADVLTVNAYDPTIFSGSPEIIAVRDVPSDFGRVESEFLGFSPEGYFNSGWLILNRRNHKNLFELCKRASRRLACLRWSGNHLKALYKGCVYESLLNDQAIINHMTFRTRTPVRFLDWRYNFMLFEESGIGVKVSNILSIHLLSERKRHWRAVPDIISKAAFSHEIDPHRFYDERGEWSHYLNGTWKCDFVLEEDGTIRDWPHLNYWFVDTSERMVICEMNEIRFSLRRQSSRLWMTDNSEIEIRRRN